MLRVAQSRLDSSIPLTGARAERLPFPDAAFHWVISTSVFHYIREPETALGEFRRVLKPAGTLVITDWCDDYPACKLCDLVLRIFSKSHFRTYTRKECARLLHESRFEPVVVERYRISWLWGLMTARARRNMV